MKAEIQDMKGVLARPQHQAMRQRNSAINAGIARWLSRSMPRQPSATHVTSESTILVSFITVAAAAASIPISRAYRLGIPTAANGREVEEKQNPAQTILLQPSHPVRSLALSVQTAYISAEAARCTRFLVRFVSSGFIPRLLVQDHGVTGQNVL